MCDNYNTVHCAGHLCSRWSTCAHFYACGSAVDWSTYGSGSVSTNGLTLETPICGDHSDPPYAKYESMDLFHVNNAKRRMPTASWNSILGLLSRLKIAKRLFLNQKVLSLKQNCR